MTSFTSPTVGAGSVVNDVERVYNSFAQLVTEYQEHSGAVNTSTSANVQYRYADGSANTVRPTALVYPNSLTRVLNYSYGTSGGMDDALSRVASLIDNDGSTHLADYTRLGVGTFVQQSSPQPQIAWSLINGTGSDPYTGLDQFNRVVDSRWYSTSSNSDVDRIQHGYDAASNRLWRKNTVADAAGVYLDELYSHDGLYRLSEAQRGQLNSSNNGLVSDTLGFAQAWGLDPTGNWSQFWENDSGSSWNLQQTRTANKVNEITGITGGGWIVPSYDSAGNAVQVPIPTASNAKYTATYDAWNRLVSVYEDGTTLISTKVYDGLDRRATETSYGTTRHFYYTASWQVIEERLGTSSLADRQFVWGRRYIDDLILRDCSDFTPARLYALQDPNWNVTAIIDSTGTVKERYDYAAYGQPEFYQPSFADLAESSFGWETLYAGYRYDAILFYYLARHRWFDYLTGRWLSRESPRLNGYAYVAGRPLVLHDSSGRSPDDDDGYIDCTEADIECIEKARQFAIEFLDKNKNCFKQLLRAAPRVNPKCSSTDLTDCIISVLKATKYTCESSTKPLKTCAQHPAAGYTDTLCGQIKSEAALGEVRPLARIGAPQSCQPCKHPIAAANDCTACEGERFGTIRTTLCSSVGGSGKERGPLIKSISDWCDSPELKGQGEKYLAVLLVHEATHSCVGGHHTTRGGPLNPLSFDVCGRPDPWGVHEAFQKCIGLPQ